jgi:hypothetical protein
MLSFYPWHFTFWQVRTSCFIESYTLWISLFTSTWCHLAHSSISFIFHKLETASNVLIRFKSNILARMHHKWYYMFQITSYGGRVQKISASLTISDVNFDKLVRLLTIQINTKVENAVPRILIFPSSVFHKYIYNTHILYIIHI